MKDKVIKIDLDSEDVEYHVTCLECWSFAGQ